MIILVAIIIVGIFAFICKLACDYSTTSYQNKMGKESFDKARDNAENAYANMAKRTDSYYEKGMIGGPNFNRWSDGSMKYDSATGKSYAKGEKAWTEKYR
mgnify:CR=1 FL=1